MNDLSKLPEPGDPQARPLVDVLREEEEARYIAEVGLPAEEVRRAFADDMQEQVDKAVRERLAASIRAMLVDKAEDATKRAERAADRAEAAAGAAIAITFNHVKRAMRPRLRALFQYFVTASKHNVRVRAGARWLADKTGLGRGAVEKELPTLRRMGFLAKPRRRRGEMTYRVQLDFDVEKALGIIQADRAAAAERLATYRGRPRRQK